MATIGSLSVAFEANTSSLESSIASVISALSDVGAAVDELKGKLAGLSSASVSVSVSTSDIEDLATSLDEIRAKAEDDITVDVAAKVSGAEAIDDVGGSAAAARSSISAFDDAVSKMASNNSITSFADAARAGFSAVSDSAASVASAAEGVSAAIGRVSNGASLESIGEASIVAAGRTVAAFEQIKDAIQQSIPNAAGAAAVAITSLAGNMGGLSTIIAAVGGSAAATAIAWASLGAAAVSSVAAIGTFAGVMQLAKLATAGMSEEAQAYAAAGAAVVGTMAAGAVAARASAAAYRLLGTAIFSSTSASGALQSVLAGLSSAITASVGPAVALGSALGNVLSVVRVVSQAAAGSASGFASAAASSLAFSVALGALRGAATAAFSGTSALAGSLTGAAAGVAAFAAALPVTIGLSVAAAVATGRVADSLRRVADEAETLSNLSDRFGQPVQEIQKLKIAAESSGVALQSVVRAQQAFSQNASKVKIGNLGLAQTREAKAAFDQLGISLSDLKSSKPEELFVQVAKEISKIQDPAKKTQVAMDLFGRTGPQILPLLKNLEELDADLGRLGGTISNVDFSRFMDVDQSFDRLNTATAALTKSIAIPFTRMQEGWNNASAEIMGGLASLVSAFGGMVADMTAPFAVVAEIAGRIVGSLLRLAAAAVRVAAAFLSFGPIAALFETLGDTFNEVWSYVEYGIGVVEQFASTVAAVMRPTAAAFQQVGEFAVALANIFTRFLGFGDIFGGPTASLIALGVAYLAVTSSSQIFTAVMATSAGAAIASAVATAAAWVAAAAAIAVAMVVTAVGAVAVYIASVIAATATVIASCAAMHVAWLFGLGPIGLLVAGVELLVVGLVGLWAMGSSVVEFFSGWGEGKDKIDAATASTEELAAAAAEVTASQGKSGFVQDMEALGAAAGATPEQIEEVNQAFADAAAGITEGMSSAADSVGGAMGYSQEEVDSFKASVVTLGSDLADAFGVNMDAGPSMDEIRQSIDSARDGMADLSVRAARFGQAGADAASAASTKFNELQQLFADGYISLEEFNEGAADIQKNLGESLDAIKKGSPEETLRKNIELFKELDGSAKQAAKSAREIGADVQIGDKLFPRSEQVKAEAAKYAAEYSAAVDSIKQKLAQGGFQRELDARAQENQRAFDAGEIDQATFERTKVELDNTSAQEQASLAVEQANRVLDQQNAKLKVRLEFTDSIRKELETAFLTPVQKYERELKKINDSDLTASEKIMAEFMKRREAREGLLGKTADQELRERQRDLQQAADSGLISQNEQNFQASEAMDRFAKAIGVTQTPFEQFSSGLDNIANQFGFVGQPLDEVRKQLEGTPEKLALFDRALKESRDKLLQSLGIEKTPEQVFQEQMQKIAEAANATDPNKRISESQRAEAEAAAVRQRNAALGAGEDVAGRLAQRQRNIDEAFGGGRDEARLRIASNAVDMERRSAAGLDPTAAQSLAAGVAKVGDAFGVTGLSLEQIQGKLGPEKFAEYQEALKKNADAVKANLGVEKSGADQIAESRARLQKAVDDRVITEEEANKALKAQRDSLLQSLGINKTPVEEFEDAVEKIAENAKELKPEEVAKGLKEARDRFLSALGIEKSPSQQASEALERLQEAFNKNKISLDELAEGTQKVKDTLLQNLGIPLDPVVQLGNRLNDLDEALQDGLITQEEFRRGQEEARRAMLPGGDAESPVKQFERDMEAVDRALQEGLIDQPDADQRRLNLQAQLQEDLKPALDRLAPDRRAVESADVRSKAGVDTFFRILRGNDNPSLKAQLEVARNTRLIAEAMGNEDAAPVIVQLAAR